MSLQEVIFPFRHDRSYGPASASFLFLVLLAEIEGLAFLALALAAHRLDLFIDLQDAILPAAALVSGAATVAVAVRQRAVQGRMRRYTSELVATSDISAYAERFASRRPR